MRFLVTMLSIMVCLLNVNGQNKAMRHLFKDKRIDIYPYLNPTFQFTQTAGEFVYLAGISSGFIFDKHFLIGGIYNSSVKAITLPKVYGGWNQMKIKYGGFHFEYILGPLQDLHLTFPFSSGIGQLNLRDTIVNGVTVVSNPNFLYAEQGLTVEGNLWKFVKVGLGINYRYASGANNLIKSGDLSGFSFVASVKLGFFDYEETRLARVRIKIIKEMRTQQINELKKKQMIQQQQEKIIEGNNKIIQKNQKSHKRRK